MMVDIEAFFIKTSHPSKCVPSIHEWLRNEDNVKIDRYTDLHTHNATPPHSRDHPVIYINKLYINQYFNNSSEQTHTHTCNSSTETTTATYTPDAHGSNNLIYASVLALLVSVRGTRCIEYLICTHKTRALCIVYNIFLSCIYILYTNRNRKSYSYWCARTSHIL